MAGLYNSDYAQRVAVGGLSSSLPLPPLSEAPIELLSELAMASREARRVHSLRQTASEQHDLELDLDDRARELQERIDRLVDTLVTTPNVGGAARRDIGGGGTAPTRPGSQGQTPR